MNSPFYIGIVESRMDPLKMGRVQVRVFDVHSEFKSDVPTEDLPWAICIQPAESASISGVGNSGAKYLEGSMVWVFFHDGDSKQCPVIIGSAHGFPIAKTPFLSTGATEFSAGISSQTSATVAPSNANTLLDSSGNPVVTSNGTPVQTGTSDASTSCCSSVDASGLVAKYGSTVTDVCTACCNAGIKDPYAIIAILANIAKESKFKPVRENMNYSSVARLRSVFSTKFGNMEDAQAIQYVNAPELLANFVYAGIMGNGDATSGDGWKYRGGGLIQLTFTNNYRQVGSAIGVDLIGNPDSILDSKISAKAAVQYFINRFGGAQRLKFQTLEEALTTITRKVNPGGFNSDIVKVRLEAQSCKLTDAAAVETEKTAQAEATDPNNPVHDVNPSASTSEINTGVAGRRQMIRDGFADPAGKYPLDAYIGEQDVNRLSRRNVDGTSVQTRMNNRTTGIRSVSGTFDEPQPAYNAHYPYNFVYATESGHVMEFDDTVGAERINLFHKTGGYIEIDKYGNQVNKIIGDGYTIIDRNGYISITGTARITFGGDCKLVVGGNLDAEVDGYMNLDVGGNINLKSGASVNIDAADSINMVAGGTIAGDAGSVHLNSGVAAAVGHSTRSPASADFEKQIPENFLGAETLELDGADEAEVRAGQDAALASGKITQDELDKGTSATASESDTAAATSKDELPASCAIFQPGNIVDSTQVSKYFNLAMLSSKAAVSKYKIVNNNGLTDAQIACNLKCLAENSLDKIKAQYPNAFVTSGFRSGSGTSQHTLGQAADLQFTGASKSDYYAIAQWIRDNVPFDQLLLEYKTTETKQPWIHISFVSGGNRNQVMTFMNHRKYDTGLHKLEA